MYDIWLKNKFCYCSFFEKKNNNKLVFLNLLYCDKDNFLLKNIKINY